MYRWVRADGGKTLTRCPPRRRAARGRRPRGGRADGCAAGGTGATGRWRTVSYVTAPVTGPKRIVWPARAGKAKTTGSVPPPGGVVWPAPKTFAVAGTTSVAACALGPQSPQTTPNSPDTHLVT